MSLDHSQTPEEYLKHLPKVRPQLPVQKYKLDDNAFSRWSATDGTSYLYQRLRVPSDHRYAVAYGKIEPEKYIDWFFYYEEIIITVSGKARIHYQYCPPFDKQQSFDVEYPDIFATSPGTKMRWENISKDEPWVYIIVAMPAGDKAYYEMAENMSS